MPSQVLSDGARNMIGATGLFALMNIGVKWLERIPAHEIVFFRAGVSLVVGYLLIRRAGLSPWGHHRPLLILRGVAGTIALILYFYTLHGMPLASAVTIQHLAPLFTILLSGLLLKEPASLRQWGYFVVAFSGVALVKGFDPRVTGVELLMGMGSAAFAGLAYNLVRLLKDHDHPLVVVFYFPLVTVPVISGYTLTHFVWPEVLELVVLVAVGLCTTLAQILLTRAYQLDKAANVSIFNYLGIIIAVLLGYLLFGEVPTLLGLLGVAIIALGVFLGSQRQVAAGP